MKDVSRLCLALVLVALSGEAGCQKKSTAFPLSLATVAQLHSGRLSFAERGDEIVVSVTDQFGDCHIHQLEYLGQTKPQALAALRSKQIELEKAEANTPAHSSPQH